MLGNINGSQHPAGKPQLRPYQVDLIDRLRHSYRTGHRAPIMQGATGMGKTVVFSNIIDGAQAKGNSTLVVVHRRELISQSSRKLTDFGVPHGIIAAGLHANHDAPVQVASIQTLNASGKWIGGKLPKFDLIVLDEAHHTRAETWRKLIEDQPGAKLLGCTATPARLDGKGLGKHCDGFFDDLVLGPSTADLIRGGYLSPVKCFVPPIRINRDDLSIRSGDFAQDDVARHMVARKQEIFGDIISHYRRLADRRPTIVFCPRVDFANDVANLFLSYGYRAAMVCGDTPKDERDRLIAGLGNGQIDVLTNCALIDEGLDVPVVGAVILLRPTKSLVLHRQQIGRGMRPADGKDALIVIDHVGNVLEHGSPEDEPLWSLDGVEKKSGDGLAPIWVCPDCGCANPAGVKYCRACGCVHDAKSDPVLAQAIDAQLVAYQAHQDAIARVVRMSHNRAIKAILTGTFKKHEIYDIALRRGHKPGWAWHRCEELKAEGRLRY
jgi:superfamily II DNA or RNA helicase